MYMWKYLFNLKLNIFNSERNEGCTVEFYRLSKAYILFLSDQLKNALRIASYVFYKFLQWNSLYIVIPVTKRNLVVCDYLERNETNLSWRSAATCLLRFLGFVATS